MQFISHSGSTAPLSSNGSIPSQSEGQRIKRVRREEEPFTRVKTVNLSHVFKINSEAYMTLDLQQKDGEPSSTII